MAHNSKITIPSPKTMEHNEALIGIGQGTDGSHAKLYPTAQPSTSQTQLILREEHYLKQLASCANPKQEGLYDPKKWLIDPFASKETFINELESAEEAAVPKVLDSRKTLLKAPIGSPCTETREKFMEKWVASSAGLLEGIDWSDLYACGGAVLNALLSETVGNDHSDIDLFLCVDTPEEANAKLDAIYQVVKRNSLAKVPDIPVEVFKSTRTISIKTPFTMIQVVLALFRSVVEVLYRFDVDSCCVGFDGTNVWVTERCRRAITKRYNHINFDYSIPGRYERRLFKYSKRGFAVAVPGYDMTKVDPSVYTKRIKEVEGLDRLLVYSKLVGEMPNFGDTRHRFVTTLDNCIHGGTTFCAHCHLLLTAEQDERTAALLDTSQPLTWAKDNNVLQDFDLAMGFERELRTKQTVPKDWDAGVYARSKQEADAGLTPMTLPKPDHPEDYYYPPISAEQGLVTPMCYCGNPASIKTVKKSGPNTGRRFFSCTNLKNPQCKYFLWVERGMAIAQIQEEQGLLDKQLNDLDESEKLVQLLSLAFMFGRITAQERAILKTLVSTSEPLTNAANVFYADNDLDKLAQAIKPLCAGQPSPAWYTPKDK